jgi:hypothetical protein
MISQFTNKLPITEFEVLEGEDEVDLVSEQLVPETNETIPPNDDRELGMDSFMISRTALRKHDRITVKLSDLNGHIKVDLITPVQSTPVVEETEEESRKRGKWMEFLQTDGNRTKVKLCLSNTIPTSFLDRKTRLLAPALSMLDVLPEFGFLHTSLLIGAYKYEWNAAGLTYPRPAKSGQCVACIDLYTITNNDELNALHLKALDVLVKWNTTIVYDENPTDISQGKGNCQMFVEDLLTHLGLEKHVLDFPPIIMQYLKSCRSSTLAEMKFPMSKEFREKFAIKEHVMMFKTHRDLDMFVCKLNKRRFSENRNFLGEQLLLKSFCRAFWLGKRKCDAERVVLAKQQGNSCPECPEWFEDFEPGPECPFQEPHRTNSIPDMSLLMQRK